MTSSHAAGPAWSAFPHPDKSYRYSAAALRKHYDGKTGSVTAWTAGTPPTRPQ